MNKFLILLALVTACSCARMQVAKESSPVQTAGFWCEALHGAFTYGAYGPTEAEARGSATNSCLKVYKDGPCEIASCKSKSK